MYRSLSYPPLMSESGGHHDPLRSGLVREMTPRRSTQHLTPATYHPGKFPGGKEVKQSNTP